MLSISNTLVPKETCDHSLYRNGGTDQKTMTPTDNPSLILLLCIAHCQIFIEEWEKKLNELFQHG